MKKRKLGFLMAISSACMWGISGNITEYIYRISDIESYNLVTVRALISGIILTILSLCLLGKKDIKTMINNKILILKMVYYSIFGVILTQLPFFKTIEYSSAQFATLLQFMTPIFIIIFGVSLRRIKPRKIEYIVTITAFIGLYFMLTNGSVKTLQVSPRAIFWGILSAIGFSVYLLYEKKFSELNKITTCGISMFIAGIILLPGFDFQNILVNLGNIKVVISLILNIIIGTVIPFYLFLCSLDYIPPRTTSLLGCFEPLTAMFVSIVLFNTVLGSIQLMGALIIIISVIVLSL